MAKVFKTVHSCLKELAPHETPRKCIFPKHLPGNEWIGLVLWKWQSLATFMGGDGWGHCSSTYKPSTIVLPEQNILCSSGCLCVLATDRGVFSFSFSCWNWTNTENPSTFQKCRRCGIEITMAMSSFLCCCFFLCKNFAVLSFFAEKLPLDIRGWWPVWGTGSLTAHTPRCSVNGWWANGKYFTF